ncbi:carbamoyl phosphate synthase large subunit [Cytobacillus sp. Hm23]
MPKDTTIQSILVIGSGPIIIGQAAEFDYSGTQGCKALKEEGYRVILINNNPATIMTDDLYADVVYFEPLTVDCVTKIIAKERPDGLLATLGGQTGLNLAFSLYEEGALEKYSVRLLGTSIESIKKGEDREEFRELMKKLDEPVPESEIVTTLEGALGFATKVDFPIIIRPAYTLGGTGGGIAYNEEQFKSFVTNGLLASPISQCLIEKSVAGFKEIEYEVMRDSTGTCITICNMENIDPVGIHTGDSIVVAPSQTISDNEYQLLRTASIKIISALGIVGGCNIQFALDPYSKQYYLIEVNPRVSRSSALASKATGYPIAKIAAKLAVGYSLAELTNPVTGYTFASFEPSLDYTVVKIPRWPFDKFPAADRTLGTQMKATGEVMALDRNIERAIQKAIQSLELESIGLLLKELCEFATEPLLKLLKEADDRRLFVILELLRREISVDVIFEHTKINYFFLHIFSQLIDFEQKIKHLSLNSVTKEEMQQMKEKGFSDEYIALLWNVNELDVRSKRKALGIVPSYKIVDTCAAEFKTKTAYYYSSYFGENELAASSKEKVLIIGSGPIRIGQGIEFDYSSVHACFALQQEGYETILINNNPETVSTDYETADRLYFEPLIFEDVLNVIEAEGVEKVIVQFGGQTAINLVQKLESYGVEIVGTSHHSVNLLEDRDLFYKLLSEIDVPHVPGKIALNEYDILEKAREMGYPILLRPSYVIGGKGMVTYSSEQELKKYMNKQTQRMYPVLIDAFIPDKEVEIDVLSDGKNIVIPTIIEHIERAGVHSGDSYAVLPAYSLTEEERDKIVAYTERIAQKLSFTGVMNIQFVINKGDVFVLEVNPRASRTVPIVSKVTNTPIIQIATKLLLGKYTLDQLYGNKGLLENQPYYTVKSPVFSINKLNGVDPTVGPEMKATGEGISIALTINEALAKTFHSYLQSHEGSNEIFIDLDDEQDELKDTLYHEIEAAGLIAVEDVNIDVWLKKKEALAVISINDGKQALTNRIKSIAHSKQVFTQYETVKAFFTAISHKKFTMHSIQEWQEKSKLTQEVVI